MVYKWFNITVNICLFLLTGYHILFDSLPVNINLLLSYLLFLILLNTLKDLSE